VTDVVFFYSQEELDLKKERVELRYKPHKRGAKESWLPIRDKKEKKEKKAPKVPRVPKEKKQTAPKDPKERRPTRAEVTVEKVKKGQVVPIDATVRVFWPLDDAWYGGRVVGHNEKTSGKKDKETGEAKVTALHTVLYHDGVQEVRVSFNAFVRAIRLTARMFCSTITGSRLQQGEGGGGVPRRER
jgi:hypothetical protein